MTFGGQTILSSDDYKDLFKLKKIRPFLDLKMSQISFSTVLLQENQIFVTDFQEQITLTPASAATHIPQSIYNYMDENFFSYLCKRLDAVYDDMDGKKITIKNQTS